MRTTLASDTVTVFSRELRPVLRDPFSVIFSMLQPLFFLALFAPLLPDVVGSESALQWFVPGIILMSCLFGTSATGANLLYEIQTGSHERMLVSPLRRPALIIGRALKEIVPMFAQTVLIIAVTFPFGFRLHLAGTVMGLLILAVFCVGLAALSYTLALASKNQEWMFWAIQQTLIFPLLLLAGMLLPDRGGPRLAADAFAVQPADLRRRRRARAVQRRDDLGDRRRRRDRGRRRGVRGPVRRHPRDASRRGLTWGAEAVTSQRHHGGSRGSAIEGPPTGLPSAFLQARHTELRSLRRCHRTQSVRRRIPPGPGHDGALAIRRLDGGVQPPAQGVR
jgi:ABC-2 type transport system permease protein